MNYRAGQTSSKVSSSETEANISDTDLFGKKKKKKAWVWPLELGWGRGGYKPGSGSSDYCRANLNSSNANPLCLQMEESCLLVDETLVG